MRRFASLLAICVAAAACSTPTSTSSPGGTASVSPSSSQAPTTGGVAAGDVRLVQVATLDQPLALTIRAGDPALYVAEKTGRVVAIRGGQVDRQSVLNLSQEVSLGGEQGLLGMAFSPDGQYLYVDFTDVNGNTRIEEFAMGERVADPASRREVLSVEQPYSNHNGGNLVFGPDGYLYIGLGDGGSGGDPHDNAQSLSTLLGKMLRISPRPSGDAPYTVPSDNPFVGEPDARPEIWAYGLRNPWRYSFDRETGDLWIGDVGQSAWEEVDLQPAASSGGENYGWNRVEGTHDYSGDGRHGSTPPVYEYSHDHGGCVVTGGYVYRGSAMPDLVGAYVFADFCLGQLEALRLHDGQVVGLAAVGAVLEGVTSFGQDAAGELYVMSIGGGLYRLAPG